MQILNQDYPRITLIPETLSDLWYLEKIVDPGDLVSSTSLRKFVSETGKSERKRVWIKLKVEKVDFQKFSNVLRILGTIVEGRPEELVSFGAYHTLEVKPGTKLTLEKTTWLNYHKEILERAIKASKKPRLVLVSLDDSEALVYSLAEVGLEKIGEFHRSGGKDMGNLDSIWASYFHEVAKALSNIDVQNILVGGPGFVKNDFYEFVKERYPGLAKKLIIVDLVSSGFSGIKEMLSRPEINRILEETRIARETKLVNDLMAEISKDGLAVYGLAQVEEALDYGAVEKLIISESFFSENREKCEELMQKAEHTRAEIHIIGQDTDAGKQLKALGGIAAILRFKI